MEKSCLYCSYKDDAQVYLSTHKIPELLEHLASWLMYSCPDDPKSFLIDHLKKLQERKEENISLLDENNLTAMFQMLDIQCRGFITLEQYKQAMISIGVTTEYNKEPIGGQSDKITPDTFVHEAKRAIKKFNRGFIEPI